MDMNNMDIIKSFENAFDKKKSKGWDKIYVLVDIHDTIFKEIVEPVKKNLNGFLEPRRLFGSFLLEKTYV